MNLISRALIMNFPLSIAYLGEYGFWICERNTTFWTILTSPSGRVLAPFSYPDIAHVSVIHQLHCPLIVCTSSYTETYCHAFWIKLRINWNPNEINQNKPKKTKIWVHFLKRNLVSTSYSELQSAHQKGIAVHPSMFLYWSGLWGFLV